MAMAVKPASGSAQVQSTQGRDGPSGGADHMATRERPESVHDLVNAIAAADAVIIATPEYNHSIPGGLKNALDWASRPFEENPLRNKPALVIGASTGLFGAVWAQAEARKVLGALGARVLDDELPVGMADGAFDESGSLMDPDLEQRLRDCVATLAGEQVMVA